MKKIKAKKKHKKLNYFNLITLVLIPIILSSIASFIAGKSYQNEKRTKPPIFYLIKDSKNNNIVKIENIGGLASYFKITKTTLLKFNLGDEITGLNITYTDKYGLWELVPNIEEKDTWYFSQTARTVNHDQIKNVFDQIIKESNTENDLELISIIDYYNISYYDYENKYHTYTYTINRNGLGIYAKEPTYEGYFGISGMIAYNDEVFYENLANYITDEIELYHQYLEWQENIN